MKKYKLDLRARGFIFAAISISFFINARIEHDSGDGEFEFELRSSQIMLFSFSPFAKLFFLNAVDLFRSETDV